MDVINKEKRIMNNKSIIFMIDASGSMTLNGRNDALNVAMNRLFVIHPVCHTRIV